MSKLVSLLKEKCPNCGRGDVFKDKGNVFLLRLPKMHDKCQVCNYYFDREPGYYWGAMYFSYAFAIAEAIGVYILCWFLFDDPFIISLKEVRSRIFLWVLFCFTSKKVATSNSSINHSTPVTLIRSPGTAQEQG